MKKIAISQSNYIPWKGYFDLINSVDEFVLYDDVQYTKRDWRNRNLIKTAGGLRWLTIPVLTAQRFHQTIRDTQVADPAWAGRHWQSIELAYRSAPAWDFCQPWLSRLYEEAPGRSLSEVNVLFLGALCRQLGICTPIRSSGEFQRADGRSERLAGICRELGGDIYYSGPAAADYLDQAVFSREGIEVRWMDYGGYPPYHQLHGAFEHRVSVLDLLLNEGPQAPAFLKSFGQRSTPT